MKPFRATYQKTNYLGEPEEEPEQVTVITILPEQSVESGAEAVFIHPDGRLDQDYIHRFTNCTAPWPEN